MTERHSKFLVGTLLLSLLLHLATLAWFAFSPRRQTDGNRGVVTVDFVQPASHQTVEAPTPRAIRPREKVLTKTDKATPVPEPAQTATPSGPVGPVGNPDASGREASAFIVSVSHLLNQKKIYPRQSLEREEEGRVVVGITLGRGGELQNTVVEEPSNFSRLNEAALETVRKVAKFPAVPETLAAPIHLHVPIIFQIEHGN